MAALRSLNPKAEVMGASAALFMNINAAKGLRDVMATNLGPRGTIKMLVGGAGGATASMAAETAGAAEPAGGVSAAWAAAAVSGTGPGAAAGAMAALESVVFGVVAARRNAGRVIDDAAALSVLSATVAAASVAAPVWAGSAASRLAASAAD